MKKTKVFEPKHAPRGRNTTAPSHADISARAARIWEQKGRPEGRDQEIWLEAERLLARGSGSMDDENDELDALFPTNSGDATTSL